VADASGVTDTSGHDHYGGKEGAFLRFNDSNEGITVMKKELLYVKIHKMWTDFQIYKNYKQQILMMI
jgi:hypothetical protein